MITPARRRMIHAIRWLSLPMALLCLGVPFWSTVSTYQHYAGMTLTEATVLSARVTGSYRMGASYDVYARYPVGDRIVSNNVTVSVTLRRLSAGDDIKLFVDPKTGDAEDDDLPGSWEMVGWGAAAAVFFVLVGFRHSGKVLRRGRL